MNSSMQTEENERGQDMVTAAASKHTKQPTSRLFFARLAIGLVVLICAEVFSGASLGMGLWHPWTLVVTFWLYYAHFFFFTTLAVRTGRTSLASLYLWGVLFGLYESWITKVIWNGYSGDGEMVLGSIGPFGYSELSMVFLFHPVVSFILPLAVACLLCPSLRRVFPELAWLTGKSRWAWWVRVYLIISFAPVMAMNSGGPVNLVVNIAAAVVCLLVLLRLGRPVLESPDGQAVVVFARWGFAGLCAYLALLYGMTYFLLRPDGLPSLPVQSITLVFYALVLVGLWYHHPSKALQETEYGVDKSEWHLVKRYFAILVVLAIVLSLLAGNPVIYLPIMLNFVIWTILGFVLTALAIAKGPRRRHPIADQSDKSITQLS